MKKCILITTGVICFCLSLSGQQLRYKNVFIRWKSIRGAFGYNVEVKDKDNKKVIDLKVDKNEVNMRIPEGKYKLRIGSLNRSKKIESWSDWKNITIVVKDPPRAPEKLVARKIITGRNSMNIVLSWKPPAGSRAKLRYIIIDMSSDKPKKIAITESGNHIIRKVKRGRDYTFKIFALNSYGEESEHGVTTLIEDWNIPMTLSAKVSFIMPMGPFSDLFDYGGGAVLSYTFNNLFINNLYAGPEVGYYYMIGSESLNYEHYSAESSHIIPISILVGYSFQVSDSLTVDPVLTCGVAGNFVSYSDFEQSRSKVFWEPLFKAGLTASYKYDTNYSFYLGGEYAMMLENEGAMQFLNVSLGVQYLLDFI